MISKPQGCGPAVPSSDYVAESMGFGVRIEPINGLDSVAILGQVAEALSLIEESSSRLMSRIRSDIDWIIVVAMDTVGEYHQDLRACHLGSILFEDPEYAHRHIYCVVELACTIVHEACHARLYEAGVRETGNGDRIERLCRTQEKRFLEKAKLIGHAAIPESLDHHYFTRYGMCESWQYSKHQRSGIRNWLGELWPGTREPHSFFEYVWSEPECYAKYVRELRRTLAIDSRNAAALYSRAYELSVLRRYSDSVNDLRSCAEIDGCNSQVWFQLGKVAWYGRQGNLAYDAFKQALAIRPSCTSILIWLLALLNQLGSRPQESAEIAERLVAEGATHSLLVRQSEACLLVGRLEQASQIIEEVLSENPRDLAALRAAIRLFAARGNDARSEENWIAYCDCFEKAIDENSQVLKQKGIVLNSRAHCTGVEMQVLVGDGMISTGGLLSLSQRVIRRHRMGRLEDEYYDSLLRPDMYRGWVDLPVSLTYPNSARVLTKTVPTRFLAEDCQSGCPVDVCFVISDPDKSWLRP